MSAVISVCTAVCAAAIAGSLASVLMPEGNTKRVVSLVLGAFLFCSMIAPVNEAISGFNAGEPEIPPEEEITATADEIFTSKVLDETSDILSRTLEGYLKSEKIPFLRTKFYLCRDDNLGIIISRICIYIKKKDNTYVFKIKEITEKNFGQTPFVIAEK